MILSNRVSKAIRRLHTIHPTYFQMRGCREDDNGHVALSGPGSLTMTVSSGLGYSSLMLNRQNLSASRQQSILPPSRATAHTSPGTVEMEEPSFWTSYETCRTGSCR